MFDFMIHKNILIFFSGTRHGYLKHLSQQHNLQLGNPQNLVFVDRLINKIEEKLSSLQCIYCEKTFPDRNTLKEHMRKKIHKRINPHNKNYDEFYIINYLEEEQNWQMLEKEQDHYAVNTGNNLLLSVHTTFFVQFNLKSAEFKFSGTNSDDEYEDWCEREDQISCLFCTSKETNINNLCLHIDAEHDFDFVEITKNFDFYQKIKLVNYIRKQMHNNKCIYCDTAFDSYTKLQYHLKQEQHYKVPNKTMFDHPE